MAGPDNIPNMSYRNLNTDENYFDIPDLTRRIPIHDDYLANRDQLIQYTNRVYHSHEDLTLKRYIGSGVAFVSLVAENLLSHPFLVLRRQCQVHHASQRYHLLPFTLLPAVCHLHQHQGLTTLWKGLGSVLLVRGMSLGVEDLISKVTPWPKEISWHSSLKQFFQHTLLKCDIASEKPGILDVFREGFMRLLNWGAPAKGRMLPIWALIVPTVTLGLAKYLFSMMVKGATGTRTIVDNLDNGRSVLPILTNYAGAIDCYESCLATEGVCGLYKGFGALILQYFAHIALIRMSHFLLTEIGTLLRKPKPKPEPPVDISPPAISNLTTSRRSYLLP
ncbi:hypothetical protein NQ314_014252 [Rhamnusium bicolor]|uniref:Solute carrier family 25 member 46 n=1 Tax=Rhamnusium bicolor TaxID=1586634 RepID=A0AAV8X2P3_9CUCU|nr:hypothetical protein NQ314_014252 [Rhamnusium bicolor]